MSEHDAEDLRARVAKLEDALEAERRVSDQWRRVAEERRVAMERLRQRRVVRFVLAIARVVMPWLHRGRRVARRAERRSRRVASGLLGLRHRASAGRREQGLRAAVAALPSPPTDPRAVAVVVLTRDGREHLERLLPWLQGTGQQTTVIVVDNASGPETATWLDDYTGIEVLRNASNLSFAEANNAAVAATEADVIVFLNDDVEPLDEGWLDRMLRLLKDDVAAVGAQLVYPRRSLLDGRVRDVSVQHRGIRFEPVGDEPPRPVHIDRFTDVDPTLPPTEVAAATAACLAVDRRAFEAVGGFDTAYAWGAEDVDLCWRLRQAGHRVVVAPDAVLWHREGATRHREDLDARNARQATNWTIFEDRWGPGVRRAVALDRLDGAGILATRPYEVAITITRDLESAGYGDWYTAHELGEVFGSLGWRVRYIERYRDAWYDLPAGVDAVIVLHDVFDVRRVARPGLTTVAWVRNWVDRWLSHPWFDDLDIVLASSRPAAGALRRDSPRTDVPVIPLATNPDRFVPGPDTRDGVVLTANNWGHDRGIEALVGAVPELLLYGKGWHDVPGVAGSWRGQVGYEDLPGLYGRSLIVVDQTAEPTRDHGFVNSRVFDAAAAGAFVISDQAAGLEDLFGPGAVATYQTPEELAVEIERALADPAGTAARAARLRDTVTAEHTYARRGAQLAELLAARVRRPSILLRTGAPNAKEARSWGDTYFAESMAAELHARGHETLIQTLDQWSDRRGRGHDISLHLRGRSRVPPSDGQVQAIWVISHPEEVGPDEIAEADLVFAASPRLAQALSTPERPVHVLLQATDARRFRPRPPDRQYAHDLVFVGNSRFVERHMVRDALEAGLPLTIYGANWERYVASDLIAGRFVPNEELPVVYCSAKVVLNDHWPGMRDWGLVSNRVFDVLACGGCLVSDDVPGLTDLFGDAVAVAEGPDDLRAVVARLLDDGEERARMGRAGRDAVVAAHTFAHRAEAFMDVVLPVWERASERPRGHR